MNLVYYKKIRFLENVRQLILAYIPAIIIIFIMVLCFNANIYAQNESNESNENNIDENSEEKEEVDNTFYFKPAIGFGGMVIGDENYMAMASIFAFEINKFKAEIALDFHINKGGKFRTGNWDSLPDWMAKITHIVWGKKGERPVFAKFGVFDSYYFGHSTIVSSFSNTKNEPIYNRRGIMFDLDVKFLGIESLISDVSTAPIAGLRLYLRPLSFITNASQLLKDIEIGFTYVTDTAPDRILSRDATGEFGEVIVADALSAGSALSVIGIDVGAPLLNNKKILSMLAYIDFNIISGLGKGLHFGLYGSIAPEKVGLFYKLEGLISFGKYVGSFFDSKYYNIRGRKYGMLNDDYNDKTNFGIGFILGKVFLNTEHRYLRIAFGGSELIGDNIGGEIGFNFIMYGVIPRLNLYFSYVLWNIWKWTDFAKDEYNRTIKFGLGYQIKGVVVNLSYERSLIYDIALAQFQPTNTFVVSTEIFFNIKKKIEGNDESENNNGGNNE